MLGDGELCDDCEEEAGAWLRWLDPSERNIEQPLRTSAVAETVTRIARFMGYSNDG